MMSIAVREEQTTAGSGKYDKEKVSRGLGEIARWAEHDCLGVRTRVDPSEPCEKPGVLVCSHVDSTQARAI